MTQENTERFLFTKREAADVLLLSEGKTEENAKKSVDRLCDHGLLIACVIGGKRRFTPESIRACIHKHEGGNGSPP